MFFKNDLTTESWSDYELIDSGHNKKLERFGNVIVSRPETQAIWAPKKPEVWEKADARFERTETKGAWKFMRKIPESWPLSWEDTRFSVRLTSFKHTGIFPEQTGNWKWVRERVQSFKVQPQVLNLFSYTGIASIVAAQAGAFVTHVDASSTSLKWAKENAELSQVGPTSIRWILDDALKFTKREIRRGAHYDGILLDPPAFGRGAKGEVWKIEEDLPELLETLKGLLSENSGAFFLLSGYAAGYSAEAFKQLLSGLFGDVNGEYGELTILENDSNRVIPAGIYGRFKR